MLGYKLTWGIWSTNHDMMSRDVGTPEVHEHEDGANKSLQKKREYYSEMGYDIWFGNITEIEVQKCSGCGKFAENGQYCGYCGEE